MSEAQILVALVICIIYVQPKLGAENDTKACYTLFIVPGSFTCQEALLSSCVHRARNPQRLQQHRAGGWW